MRRLAWLAAFSFLVTAPAAADPPIEDTIAALDAALAASPHDARLVRRRGELLLQEGRAERALEDLRYVLAITPDDAAAHVLEARALQVLGRTDEALAAADRAVQLAPDSFAARRTRAELRRETGDVPGAIADLDAALSHGSDQDAHLERARLLRLEGRTREAALGLEAALESTYHAPPMVLATVEAWLEAGDVGHALALVTDAEARTPADVRWTILRGDVLARAGQGADARATWERALAAIDRRIAVRSTVALVVDRGEVLARLGRAAEARTALDDALARSPGYPGSRALATRLGAAGGAR